MKSKGLKPFSGLSPKRLANSTGTRRMAGAGAAGKKPIGKALKSDGSEPLGEEYIRKKQSLLKPEDQLNLTEAELNEEITKTLSSGNINSPKNLVEYSYVLGEFVPKSETSPTVVLIHLEGCCIAKDSPEAQAQIAAGGRGGPEKTKKKQQAVKQKSDSVEKDEDEGKESEEQAEEGVEATEGEGDGEEKGEDKEEEEQEASGNDSSKPKKKLTNAFNYCERAALTITSSRVNASTQTVPPPRKVFSELVTQWIIYDAYAEDYEKQQKEREKEKEKKLPSNQPVKKEDVKKKQDAQAVEAIQQKTNEAAKIVDRMICQNIYDEIAQDYKYYEDPSDEYRVEEGTLLPLWKFTYEKTKKNSVTDISWNPQYYDLFAVTFGTFEFMKQQSHEGALCLFTLKNPSYPEYVRHTESAAMCVATHPVHTHLIVIGKFDGNVAVYNIQLPDKSPQFQSNSVNKKHWGIVWQVKWGLDMQDGEINFFSVSADGKVFNWVLMQNELAVTTMVSLSLPINKTIGPDGLPINVKDCGCSITFHPVQPLIFLVGTEEGSIFKCSTAYSSIFLFKYDAHHMPVHRISYNLFYPDIFLSCSSDWRVKIWEDLKSEPLFVFDLGCSVGDVQWAPYSSTVFAAVTVDGKCHVFDINVNKYKSICVQSIVSGKKNGLNRLRFNLKMPILAVGDDKGSVTILKLSPNLRIKPKPSKKQQFSDPEQLEIIKLEKLLALVREPTTVKINTLEENVNSD